MNKEQQDKLWNELSEESKASHKQFYEAYKDYKIKSYYYHVCRQMEKTFGSHNLNPKPQLKTWEDVEKEYPEYRHDISDLSKIACVDMRILCKLIATYKIAKLIELGYGGMVTEEEMKDTSIDIYNIYPDEKKQFIIGSLNTRFYDFICFHTLQQAREFMSHESNKRLVEQYYMM